MPPVVIQWDTGLCSNFQRSISHIEGEEDLQGGYVSERRKTVFNKNGSSEGLLSLQECFRVLMSLASESSKFPFRWGFSKRCLANDRYLEVNNQYTWVQSGLLLNICSRCEKHTSDISGRALTESCPKCWDDPPCLHLNEDWIYL